MSITIEGSSYQTLFDEINKIYAKYGARVGGWRGWSSLNENFPCGREGRFIKTNELNEFMEFTSHLGSHPCLGSGFRGDAEAAFRELKQVLRLELIAEVDNACKFTYPGHKVRYYKITELKFA